MSKSKTGRKGRLRLALAAAMKDIDDAVADASIIDANGRLGASSGFLSSDDDKSNAVILDYVQGQLNKPGTANALFTQGEVRGPLANAVDTQNGANGAITSADAGGAYASATGETDVAAIVPLSTGDGTFAHYVFPDSVEDADQADAIATAAGGTATTATAQDNQALATELRGICYHPGGPGSNLVPLQHLGCSDGGSAGIQVSSTQIVINPSVDTVWGDSGVTNPASIRIEIAGELINTSGGDAGEGGDEILVQSTNNTAATAQIRFKTAGTGAAALNSFADGHQLKVRDADGTVVLTVVGHLNGNAGSDLAAAQAPGGNQQGQNFDATTDADSNIVYVIPHASAGGNGNVAYDGHNTNTNAASGIGQFVANLVAAINALSDAKGLGITAAAGTSNDADHLTLTYDKYRGTNGNAASATVAAESALTVTAYSADGQILVPTAASHAYFGDAGNVQGEGTDAATDRIPFRGGTSGTNFGTVSATVANDDGDSSKAVSVQVNVDQQDLPIRVVYNTDDEARDALSAGIPSDSSAGFVVVWGPV